MLEEISRRAFVCGAAALAIAPATAAVPSLGFLTDDVPPTGDEDVYIVRVANDTMAPRYEKGDQVYFWPRKAPRAGDYAVFEIQDETGPRFYLYRLIAWNDQTVTLRQLNPVREHILPLSEIRSAGRVIGASFIDDLSELAEAAAATPESGGIQ